MAATAAHQFFVASRPSLFVTFSAEAFLDGRREVLFRPWPVALALVLVPIIAWSLAYALAYTVRWISAGFSYASRDSTAAMFATKSDKELCELIAGFNEQAGLGYRLLGQHELQRRLRRPDAVRSWIAIGISVLALLIAVFARLIL